MGRLGKAMTTLEKGAGGNELSKVAAGQPVHAATLQLRRDIVPRLAKLLQLLGKQQGLSSGLS